jgi:hypothetical protein
MTASSEQASPRPPSPRSAENAVNDDLTPKRRRPVTENSEYAAFARRILRAYGRRIATGDVEALAQIVELSSDIDDAIRDAVNGLRTAGYSWTEIAVRIGVTRQAAQQRWGRPRELGK